MTVRGASERLGLAARSVRDLIYAGRLPSQRLGRVHYLHTPDVEAERRRRLGLPVPTTQRATHRRARPGAPRGLRAVREQPPVLEDRVPRRVDTRARRERAALRAEAFDRWLRSGHHPAQPGLPFAVVTRPGDTPCGACERRIPAGRRLVDAAAADGRPFTLLCITCARRAMLSWADERRREAVAARLLARDLGAIASASDAPSAARAA